MERPKSKFSVVYGIGKTVITFNEESILEEEEITDLEQAVMPVVYENGAKELILNLCYIHDMSPYILNFFNKVYIEVRELGGSLKFLNMDPFGHRAGALYKSRVKF
ncbi:MAG: hypothetical protein JW806_03470 [Sedimentisphaerales bacterium]|nr:hypothetical protein [Sedimentisphaerales bacterium]